MKLLADVNVDGGIVRWLRDAGHDVRWELEESPGAADADILERATDEGRIVVTFDHDFGELIFRDRKRAAGIILLRLIAPTTSELRAVFVERWPEIERHAPGRFIVVANHSIRIRPLP